MSEDKSKAEELDEQVRDSEEEPEVEAHNLKLRQLSSEDQPGMRHKRPTGH
jgi:hypothetical protein